MAECRVLLEGCHVLTYDHGSAIDVTGGGCAVSPARTSGVLWQNADGRNCVHRVALWWFGGVVWAKYPGPWGLPPHHGA
jgi:hypothetical protein